MFNVYALLVVDVALEAEPGKSDGTNSLQTLTFGSAFNQSLESVTLPRSLQNLTFGSELNQNLERVTLPSGLQALTFGSTFNQSLECVTLPPSLQDLTFGTELIRAWNESLCQAVFKP